MAKWGEGDPRWIVEERPDATNVNNWHWTEKNADAWSKSKLKDLFVGLKFSPEDAPEGVEIEIEEMDKCEGEARANQRKGKLIFFYEWEIVLKWKTNSEDPEHKQIRGKIEIPNLSEEHDDMKDVDLEISVSSGNSKDKDKVKESLRKGKGSVVLRKQLQAYVDALRTEYSQGLVLPKNTSANGTTTQSKTSTAPPAAPKAAPAPAPSASMKNLALSPSTTSGTKIDTGSVNIEESFKCTGQEIYNALTQKEMIQIFTTSEVKMASSEAKAGEDFELLGGNIQGKYVDVKPFTKLKQKWRLKSWPDGHFSDVEISIAQTADDTKVTLKQTGVPSKEIESTKQGWYRYYFEAIKRTFGFGNLMF